LWVPVCAACDVRLNELALEFFRIPGQKALLRRYQSRLTG
jgi:hypothetical protein